MRRAGHQRHASTTAAIAETVVLIPHVVNAAASACAIDMAPVHIDDPPEARLVLSPDGTFYSESAPYAESDAVVELRSERHRQLAIAIRQRIESRLGPRVRDLAIRFSGETVVLEGKCATYYTKQMAQ